MRDLDSDFPCTKLVTHDFSHNKSGKGKFMIFYLVEIVSAEKLIGIVRVGRIARKGKKR